MLCVSSLPGSLLLWSSSETRPVCGFKYISLWKLLSFVLGDEQGGTSPYMELQHYPWMPITPNHPTPTELPFPVSGLHQGLWAKKNTKPHTTWSMCCDSRVPWEHRGCWAKGYGVWMQPAWPRGGWPCSEWLDHAKAVGVNSASLGPLLCLTLGIVGTKWTFRHPGQSCEQGISHTVVLGFTYHTGKATEIILAHPAVFRFLFILDLYIYMWRKRSFSSNWEFASSYQDCENHFANTVVLF